MIEVGTRVHLRVVESGHTPSALSKFAAEAMSRERKATTVAKDMDGKGLEVRSVEE